MVSTFSKVAEALLITVCVISYVLPSMVSDCPSLIQETVVGGDPAVVQVRVEDELEVPLANTKPFEVELDTTVGGAAGKTPGFQYCSLTQDSVYKLLTVESTGVYSNIDLSYLPIL